MEAILRKSRLAILDPRAWRNAVLGAVPGNMNSNILLIIGGMVVFMVGLAIAPSIIAQAVTATVTPGIGSFAGTDAILDLLPMIFVIGLLVLGLGAMIGGGLSAYKAAKGNDGQ